MILRLIIHVIFTSGLLFLKAQSDTTYTEKYISKSTKFASLTYGFDLQAFSGGSTEFMSGGSIEKTSFGSSFTPRLTIGGIHFWGYADFYVTFPLSFLSITDEPDPFSDFTYQQGIETGARLYPFKLESGKLRPFLGVSFRSLDYTHLAEGSGFSKAPRYEKMIVPVQAGITYTTDKFLITASIYHQSIDNIQYYISPTQTGNTHFDPVSFSISFLKYKDTDKSMRSTKSVNRLNKMHKILQQENLLSAWYWGLGPSAMLQRSRSEYLASNYPYLYDDFSGGFSPDITFGRFFHKPDMNIGISFRTFGDRMEGFNTQVKVRRYSYMIEAYKNLFDWLGFVPYFGITGSLESLQVNVNGTAYQETKPALGFIAGWDIRVTNTGTCLLRTNLRWIPDLHLAIEGEKMMFDHIEFNFIQWVQFIGRKKAYQRY